MILFRRCSDFIDFCLKEDDDLGLLAQKKVFGDLKFKTQRVR